VVEDLGQRKLGLEDRKIVTNVPGAVLCREGGRQATKPFSEQAVDLRRRELVADPLEQGRVCTAQDAVVEGLVLDPSLIQLPLGVLVPVDAKLRVVGEVRAELQEERSKVPVQSIEVVLVHHGRGAVEQGI